MIISVNWLKKFTDITMSIDDLTTIIGARLVEIETVTDLTLKYKDVIVVRVVECGPLEGTDHLNLTKIDDGGVWRDVERDSNGLVQVVCGAPNVRAGMLAAWLPPASTVPDTFTDTEPFVLSSKNLRGTMSNGMLASAKELDLFDDHTGILEIDKELPAGTSFAAAYELDDYLLDIENKSLTHRPDAFGIIGFAREVAAITGTPFATPEWMASTTPTYGDKDGSATTPIVTIDDPDLSSRYQAVILSGADASRHSPLEIQTYLARVGVRPINAVVDVTNYLMMLTGQPLHAFDYDKIIKIAGDKPTIHVRSARENETLELLDGRIVTLEGSDIVISAGDTAIGLAGAMGGISTVIDDTTKNIILESATFNLYKLRSTQMRHGIFSEAITRFTKGQPAELTAPVLADAIELIAAWSGAKRVSDVVEARGNKNHEVALTITSEDVNHALGSSYTLDEIIRILRSIEFAVVKDGPDTLTVSAPYWRSDIHIIEDVFEEIGRILGFDSIKPTLPLRDFTATIPSQFDTMRTAVRRLLVRAGVNEVLTYSFIHGDVIQKSRQLTEQSYRIINSISPDLQYYRQSITPSLLGLIHPNTKQGYDTFALFEMNKVHDKSVGLTDENVPIETDSLGLVVTNIKSQQQSPYYQAKKIIDFVASSLGLELAFLSIDDGDDTLAHTPFEYRKSSIIVDTLTGAKIGVVGEYVNSVKKAFKLPSHTAGFELSLNAVFESYKNIQPDYVSLSRYPSLERDICFQVESSIEYSRVIASVEASLKDVDLLTSISPIDIYQSDDTLKKNITIRLRLGSSERTLTSHEVSSIIQLIGNRVEAELSATIV